MAAAYVSHTTGVASRSVTVPAGTDRLLVAIALSTASTGARTATYGGVSMSVATTANGWAQIFYMLSPPAGAATLAVSGANVSTVIAAHYTGIGSFQTSSGQQGSVASASFTPTTAGLIVFGLVASTTSHTPVASTNERYDTGGDYYADRLVSSGGAVTVGVSAATDPDYAGAIFWEPISATGSPSSSVCTASGTLQTSAFIGAATSSVSTASGTATVVVSATGAPSKSAATTSGTATVTVAATGSPSSTAATTSGTVGVVVSASGAVTTGSATASGTAVLIPPVGGTIELTSTLAQRVRARSQLRDVVLSSSELVQRVRARHAL